MLADGARIADGKIYIYGGQWDRLFTPSVPATHPIVAIALVVELEYHEALTDHPLQIALHDADGAEMGPKATMVLRVGHPAQLEAGSPVTVPIAMELPHLQFPRYGRYEWVIEADGQIVGRLPLTVAQPPGLPFAIAQPPQEPLGQE
jgi:hypothetical protein